MNYVVTLAFGGEQYFRFAEHLAMSASRFSQPTILITYENAQLFDPSLFHRVIKIPKVVRLEDIWAIKLRLNLILRDHGINEGLFAFVDSDSFIIKDPKALFEFLPNGFYFPVETTHNREWQWAFKCSIVDLAKDFCGYIKNEAPQINGGFFVWDQASRVANLWFSKAQEALEFLKRRGIDMEEPAMCLALCAVSETHQSWLDKAYVCQLWAAAVEHTASIQHQFAIARMPWWHKIETPIIIHHGSNYVWSDRYWKMVRDLRPPKQDCTLSVSIVIPTFARTKWLSEAVYTALRQDYNNYEVLILNDCPLQTLKCNDKRVRIINYNKRFNTVGEKRNCAFIESSSDIIVFLDDDDLITPWHVSSHVDNLIRNNAIASLSTRCLSFSRSDQKLKFGGAPIDTAFYRSIKTRFPSIDAGEDQDFRAMLGNEGKVSDMALTAPSYIYEWSNGVHHLSGSPASAVKGYLIDADARFMNNEEPTGNIVIKPALRPDIAHWFEKCAL